MRCDHFFAAVITRWSARTDSQAGHLRHAIPMCRDTPFRCLGLAWRDLLAEFGLWQTVWKRHARFSKDGTWDKVLLALQTEADAAGEIDWNVSVDSTIARVHQHGATAARSQLPATPHTGGR